MRRLTVLLSSLIVSTITFSAHAADFAMNTTAFLDTGVIPVLYTCDGKDISPQISWANPPAKTQSFVMILTDPEAPGGTFYHWIAYNIPATARELPEGSVPKGTIVGKNTGGNEKYNGPCPPKGTAHTYEFQLYALDTKLKLPAGSDQKTIQEMMKNHVVGKAKLTTVYSRWNG